MSQPQWPARLTRVIAEQVRSHRRARKMSVQQLSNAIEKLGVTIERPVLSNLENGRRSTVSVAEWLLLAAALQVPPLLLVFPVGRADVMEPLPGVEVDPLAAVLWAETGELPGTHSPEGEVLPGTHCPEGEDAHMIERYRRHRDLVGAWVVATGRLIAADSEWDSEWDAERDRLERERRVTVGALRDLRDLLRSQALILPEVTMSVLREALGEDEKRIKP